MFVMARVRSNGKFKWRLTKPKYSMIVVEVTESTPEGLFSSVYKSWQRLLSVHNGARSK